MVQSWPGKPKNDNTASVLGASSSFISDHVLYHCQQEVLLLKEHKRNTEGTQKEHKSWNCVVYTPNKLAELAFNQFGNEIKLLDAIYKTMRCDLLLFFPVAKTNINCIGLGSFIIQSETTAAICTRTVNNLPWLGWFLETLIFFDRLLPRENKCKKANIHR